MNATNEAREEFFPPVEIDAQKSPGLLFFQDRETRFTIVVDARTGEQLGRTSGAAPGSCGGAIRVRKALARWKRFERRVS